VPPEKPEKLEVEVAKLVVVLVLSGNVAFCEELCFASINKVNVGSGYRLTQYYVLLANRVYGQPLSRWDPNVGYWDYLLYHSIGRTHIADSHRR
jgi:hypothetical protein